MNSRAKTIINENDIDEILKSIYVTAISNKSKCLGKGFGWDFDSVIDHFSNISK